MPERFFGIFKADGNRKLFPSSLATFSRNQRKEKNMSSNKYLRQHCYEDTLRQYGCSYQDSAFSSAFEMFSEFPRAIFSFESPAPRSGSKIHSEIVHADLFPKRLSEMKVEFSPGKKFDGKSGTRMQSIHLALCSGYRFKSAISSCEKGWKKLLGNHDASYI